VGLRLALLSTARINEKLVTGARETDAVDVVAIGSRDLVRAEAQASSLGIERALGSYEAVLKDPDVDAVYVALPNSMHVDWSIRALRAGKHVLWRHHPHARMLVELLPRIGELRLIRAWFSFPIQGTGDLRQSAELEGGALMDVGCYCLSGARLVAGEPVEVFGTQVSGGGQGVDVRFTGVLRFEGDVLATFDCGIDVARRHGLEVVGSEGAILLKDPWHSLEPDLELRAGDGSVEELQAERMDPYACELRDLAAAVAGEREPLLGRTDAAGQARAIAALYRSAESEQMVRP
jgi:predicted dehydrogenase